MSRDHLGPLEECPLSERFECHVSVAERPLCEGSGEVFPWPKVIRKFHGTASCPSCGGSGVARPQSHERLHPSVDPFVDRGASIAFQWESRKPRKDVHKIVRRAETRSRRKSRGSRAAARVQEAQSRTPTDVREPTQARSSAHGHTSGGDLCKSDGEDQRPISRRT